MIVELAIYLVGLGVLYCALVIGAVSGYRGKVFAVLSLCVLGGIAALRGDVGTDTANYELMVSVLRNLSEWYGVEPGFSLLVWVLGWLTLSDVVLVRLLAVVFLFGLLVYVRNADQDEMFFLAAYFIPSSFYQYSMNALRIGLATVFVLLAVQHFRRLRNRSGLSNLLAGCFFHYSLAISATYIAVGARLLKGHLPTVLAIFSASILMGAVGLIYGDYLLPRVAAYSDYGPPGALSGLSVVFTLLVVIWGAAFSSLSWSSRMVFVLVALVSIAATYSLARYTYAGLRVLDLLRIAIPAALLVLHGRERLAFNSRMNVALVVAGALSAVATLHRFAQDTGQVGSPWIPYEWVF